MPGAGASFIRLPSAPDLVAKVQVTITATPQLFEKIQVFDSRGTLVFMENGVLQDGSPWACSVLCDGGATFTVSRARRGGGISTYMYRWTGRLLELVPPKQPATTAARTASP
ncbi:hypothetical protein HY632_04125 [Candidatus Uhrbacteria bacterium]|nr:hypothetical protein [Candidatus Uhrbacteria bacterium]